MHALKRSSFWAMGFAFLALTSVFSTFLFVKPVQAKDEKYTRISDTNIRIEGGSLAEAGSLDKKDGNKYEGGVTIGLADTSIGRCQYHMVLTVTGNTGTPALTALNGGDPETCSEPGSATEALSSPVTIGGAATPEADKPAIPAGCPGSANPTTPPPEECGKIPPGCPGSTQQGQKDPNVDCPYSAGGVKEGEETVKCSAESSFSWVLCPMLELAIKGSEMISGIADDLLFISPIKIGGEGNVLYEVWSNLRNLANVLFIIVMFALIFSQATSIGLSAYGVKKLLPKLIAAAILANLSYFICAFAIDFFNILGRGITDLLEAAIRLPAGIQAGEQGADLFSANDDTILGAMFGNAIAIAATAGIMVIALVFFWSTILLAVLVAFLTIALRQALIVILVIVAPIAFVLWVLPNTEKWFTKWSETFIALLVMYPMMMVLFAGSRVAAAVVAGMDFK